jgi:transposase
MNTLLLTQRRNLKRKFLDIENSIRHSLKAFGIRFKNTGRGGFEAAVREAVAGDKLTSELRDAMLMARAALWKQYCKLHDLVVKLVARNELCRRFMAIPRGRRSRFIMHTISWVKSLSVTDFILVAAKWSLSLGAIAVATTSV